MRHFRTVPCFLLALALGLAVLFVPARSASAQWAESVSPPAALTVSTATLSAASFSVANACPAGWTLQSVYCPDCTTGSTVITSELVYSWPSGTAVPEVEVYGSNNGGVNYSLLSTTTIAASATSYTLGPFASSYTYNYNYLDVADGSWTSSSPSPGGCL